MASGCAKRGGCPSDYVAVSIAVLCFFVLLSRSVLPCLIHKAPRNNSSSFWIPVIQVFSSFNLLFSIVMSINLLQIKSKHWLQYCYLWSVWVEGPLGFGLLMSCRITQAFQLYFIFVKKRLPPVKSYIFLPLVLLPWISGAAIIHAKRSLDSQCHMGLEWTFPVASLHALYVLALLAFTRAIRHVEFRFDELRDLWKGILVSATSVVIWGGILVIVFFSISSHQPLLSQISLKNREHFEFPRMEPLLSLRQEILTTQDLTHTDLFKNALNEVMQLIKMNLVRDYWSSIFFIKFKEEEAMHKEEGWSFSPPRMSSVQGSDDPFYQEHMSKSTTSPG